MKYWKKWQFLLLILAAAIFCGQELVHPVFHASMENASCHCRHHSGVPQKPNLKDSAGIDNDDDLVQTVFFEQSCPICNSVAAKSTTPIVIETQFVDYASSIYPCSCDSPTFKSYGRPFSRGPPAS